MIKEEKIDFCSKWGRFNKYNLVEHGGELYIVPDKNATFEIYDPFKYQNEILNSLLTIAYEIEENIVENQIRLIEDKDTARYFSKISEFQNKALDFVCKYGFLGNMNYFPEDMSQFSDYNPELIYFSITETMPIKDFTKKYFWLDNNIDWNEGITSEDIVRLSKEANKDLKDIITTKYYAETVYEILLFALDLFKDKVSHIFNKDFDFNNLDFEEDKDLFYPTYPNILKDNFRIGYLVIDKKLKFYWDFNSLHLCIDIMMLINETNGRNEVRLCKYCQRPFIAQNIKSEYDSISCRNKMNIRNTRKKNK